MGVAALPSTRARLQGLSPPSDRTTVSCSTRVSSGGAIRLPFYLAVYFALWGAFAATVGRPRDNELVAPPLEKSSHGIPSGIGLTNLFGNSAHSIKYAFVNAAAWTGLEWLRGVVFTGFGWNMSPDNRTDIGGLPAFTYQVDGEKKMLPCAELLLPERSAEAILGLGLMPIVSFRNRDMARLLRFQSIADPVAALEGPW